MVHSMSSGCIPTPHCSRSSLLFGKGKICYSPFPLIREQDGGFSGKRKEENGLPTEPT